MTLDHDLELMIFFEDGPLSIYIMNKNLIMLKK